MGARPGPPLSVAAGMMAATGRVRAAVTEEGTMAHAPTPDSGTAVPDDPAFTALDRIAGERYVTVRVAGQELAVTFDSLGGGHPDAGTIAGLLPRARALLADFAAVRERATAYLWEWGAHGEEPADNPGDNPGEEPGGEERAAFLRKMVPTTLAVTSATTAELHYEDVGEEYMLDGYWPVVHHDAAMTPVEVTVEA
ncbi:hypothetical protein ABT354_24105 [Streptomyces sp. NPDC000594]|uniref:hypothetical protein n=1 Tax=Streptomyces sp. NPDC000594 TaxID=3154261 RepID=UPI003316B3D0